MKTYDNPLSPGRGDRDDLRPKTPRGWAAWAVLASVTAVFAFVILGVIGGTVYTACVAAFGYWQHHRQP